MIYDSPVRAWTGPVMPFGGLRRILWMQITRFFRSEWNRPILAWAIGPGWETP
jgi:hypothetical protein